MSPVIFAKPQFACVGVNVFVVNVSFCSIIMSLLANVSRCKQWVVNCRTANLDGKAPEQLHRNYVVCGEHFEDHMFMNVVSRNSLVHNALPTIFNFPSSISKLTSKRKAPPERHTAVTVKKPRQRLSQESSVAVESVANVANDSLNHSVLMAAHSSTTTPVTDVMTPRKVALSSKLLYAQSCLKRARVALFRSRKTSSAAATGSDSVCTCSLCAGMKSLPDIQQKFFHSQVSAHKFSKYGMRYKTEHKLLALGLFYKSPAAYRFMSHTFRMPSERTLRSFIGGLRTGCGFKSHYIDALKNRVDSMNDFDKFCVF